MLPNIYPSLLAVDSAGASPWPIIITALVAAVMGMGVVKLIGYLRKQDAEKEARQILEKAEIQAAARHKEAEFEAKELALREKTRIEEQLNDARQKTFERERHLDKQQDLIEARADQLQKQEKMVENNQRKLAERLEDANRRQAELDNLLDAQRQALHQISGLSPEEAKKRLLERLDQELSHEQGALIMKHEREVAAVADVKAREILLTSIQRFAASHTAEATTSTVDIPSDEMKGRIIGREGRNIRAFEKATGVDVIIDDTPGVVIVSAFDPVRREVAKISLNKLIADGRIHPTRIEELVAETQKEIDANIRRYGEEAVQETGIRGLNERTINLLGRLHYRTSYSQNVLRHSIEVAFVASAMAEEMKMDPVLVAAADACSASRPGARRETLDRYIKRMQELETIATGFEGVEQAFAIQAGREVRVIASTRLTTDESAAKICREIAKAFEEQLTYPGEIKVTMIRESRFTETAK